MHKYLAHIATLVALTALAADISRAQTPASKPVPVAKAPAFKHCSAVSVDAPARGRRPGLVAIPDA